MSEKQIPMQDPAFHAGPPAYGTEAQAASSGSSTPTTQLGAQTPPPQQQQHQQQQHQQQQHLPAVPDQAVQREQQANWEKAQAQHMQQMPNFNPAQYALAVPVAAPYPQDPHQQQQQQQQQQQMPGAGQPQAPQNIIYTNQQPAPIFMMSQLQNGPTPLVCPFCQTLVTTVTQPEKGTITWVAAAGLCFFGCCLCVWIPCVADSLQDTAHSCPQCKRRLGLKTR
ncbi:hypothetical protein HDU86_002933, partial [Geranomyces michiganensis]